MQGAVSNIVAKKDFRERASVSAYGAGTWSKVMVWALALAVVALLFACCALSHAYADDDAASDGRSLRAGELADDAYGSKTIDGYPSTIGAPNSANGDAVKTGAANPN